MLLISQLFDVEETKAHVETIFCPNVAIYVEMIVAFVPQANFVK
jgi:hypothetical protein